MANKKAPPFEFPPHFNFPPFFTLQVVAGTRAKQMSLWTGLVLHFCRHHADYDLDVSQSSSLPLFHNPKINRSLKVESIREIFEVLVSQGNAEWLDKDKNRILIMWRRPDEWAAMLYKWICDNGLTDNVMTVWELQNSDEYKNQEWFGLNTKILLKALTVLQKQKKAEVFSSSGGDENLGVKFFTV